MDDDKILEEATKILGINDVGPEVYKDLLQPAVRETGENLLTIAKVVSIAMSPLKSAIWGFEKIQNWLGIKLTEKLSKTDPEKIQPPKMNIAGPILLQLPFCKDEAELREMYANLLASAMNKDKSASAHPSFTTIIQQLTSDEALVLKWISENYEFEYSVIFNTESFYDIYSEFESLCKSILSESFDDSNSGLYQSYLDNLQRLRLIEVNQESDVEYVPEHSDRHGSYEPSVTQNIDRKLCVTDFGAKFLETCIGDPPFRKPDLYYFIDGREIENNTFSLDFRNSLIIKIKNLGNGTAKGIRVMLYLASDLDWEIDDHGSRWDSMQIKDELKYNQVYSRNKPIEDISPKVTKMVFVRMKSNYKDHPKALEEAGTKSVKLEAFLKIFYGGPEPKSMPFTLKMTFP